MSDEQLERSLEILKAMVAEREAKVIEGVAVPALPKPKRRKREPEPELSTK